MEEQTISSKEFMQYAHKYLKPGTYIITKHGKKVYTVVIKDYTEPEKATYPDFKKPFAGPIEKEYSKR